MKKPDGLLTRNHTIETVSLRDAGRNEMSLKMRAVARWYVLSSSSRHAILRSLFFSKVGGEKRVPEGLSTKVLPASTPSGPRAMSSGENLRGKVEPTRERHRDAHASQKGPPLGSSNAAPSIQDSGTRNLGSLRSRISEESPHPSSQAPSSYRPDASRDEDREGRKRTASGMYTLSY